MLEFIGKIFKNIDKDNAMAKPLDEKKYIAYLRCVGD